MLRFWRYVRRLSAALPVALALVACGDDGTATPLDTATPTQSGGSATPNTTLATTPAGSPTATDAPTLTPPLYTNARPLDLGGSFDFALRRASAAIFGTAPTTQMQITTATTADSPVQIAAFYDDSLPHLGYARVGLIDVHPITIGQADTSGVLYATSKSADAPVLVVATVGSLSDSDITGFARYNVDIDGRVKPKETFIEVFSALTMAVLPPGLTIPDPALTNSPPNVPPFAAATSIPRDASFMRVVRQNLVGLVGKDSANTARVDFFASTDPAPLTFYTGALPQIGENSLGSLQPSAITWFGTLKAAGRAFGRGADARQSGTLVLTYGPLDTAQLAELRLNLPTLDRKLAVGQTLVVVVTSLSLAQLPQSALQDDQKSL